MNPPIPPWLLPATVSSEFAQHTRDYIAASNIYEPDTDVCTCDGFGFYTVMDYPEAVTIVCGCEPLEALPAELRARVEAVVAA